MEYVCCQPNQAGRALGFKTGYDNLCDLDNKLYELLGDSTPNKKITITSLLGMYISAKLRISFMTPSKVYCLNLIHIVMIH